MEKIVPHKYKEKKGDTEAISLPDYEYKKEGIIIQNAFV